jgi:hypothetical protein
MYEYALAARIVAMIPPTKRKRKVRGGPPALL